LQQVSPKRWCLSAGLSVEITALFYHDDGGNSFLRNISTSLQNQQHLNPENCNLHSHCR
jgi:hypothetical protein